MEKKKLNRLESLDVLRGFDLFCLVVLEMVLHPLAMRSICLGLILLCGDSRMWNGRDSLRGIS